MFSETVLNDNQVKQILKGKYRYVRFVRGPENKGKFILQGTVKVNIEKQAREKVDWQNIKDIDLESIKQHKSSVKLYEGQIIDLQEIQL